MQAQPTRKKKALPLPAGPPDIPVVRPSEEEFADLERFLRTSHSQGLQHGAIKVVPPEGYAARRTYGDSDVLMRSCASQVHFSCSACSSTFPPPSCEAATGFATDRFCVPAISSGYACSPLGRWRPLFAGQVDFVSDCEHGCADCRGRWGPL